jgi:hypothetical protein
MHKVRCSIVGYFVSRSTHWGILSLLCPKLMHSQAGVIFNSLKFLQKEGLKINAFVILENHMHFILQSDNLSKDIQRLKSFTAKKIINFLQQKNIKTILEQLAFYKKSHKSI